jgi:hypothetical protein
MIELTFYPWRAGEPELQLLERIAKTLASLADQPVDWSVREIASYGEVVHDTGWGITFPNTTQNVSAENDQCVELPTLDLLFPEPRNKQFRQGAYETLEMVAGATKEEKEPEAKLVVESPEGHTVGKKGTDFEISEQELEYAKKIRDLIPGCSITIKKGDMQIKV